MAVGQAAMAAPLLVYAGASALAGGVFMALGEAERVQRISAMRQRDVRLQQLLRTAGSPNLRLPEDVSNVPPMWVLIVVVGETALVSPKVARGRFQMQVKYGRAGWSLRRSTPVLTATRNEGRPGQLALHFQETCVFLFRRDLEPVIRLRLLRHGRLRGHTMAKKDLALTFEGPGPFFHELVVQMEKGGSPPVCATRLAVELRPVILTDLMQHGLNVGQVVQGVGLAEALQSEPPPPVIMGEAVARAPGAGLGATASRLPKNGSAASRASSAVPGAVSGVVVEGEGGLREAAATARHLQEERVSPESDSESEADSEFSQEISQSSDSDGSARSIASRGGSRPCFC